jgi:hypothetical protein
MLTHKWYLSLVIYIGGCVIDRCMSLGENEQMYNRLIRGITWRVWWQRERMKES